MDIRKVFLNSTYKDLVDYRKAAVEGLEHLGLTVECMEKWPGDPREPTQASLDRVEECDALVLLLAHRYGFVPDGSAKSVTEQEYDHARKLNKPCFCFIVDKQQAWIPDFIDDDPGKSNLIAFKKRVKDEVVRATFTDPGSLRQAVTETVARFLIEQARKEGKARPLLTPAPPTPYLAHPYALQENFTGRRTQRTMLTEWVRDDAGHPMLSLEGMGGMGKSALSWVWLSEDLPQEKLDLSGVLWWSFYEREASFESFFNHALSYASAGTVAPEELPSDYDRLQALYCILRDSPFLLVLDGAERLLRAYHRLDAAYIGDDVKEQQRDEHRLCVDPNAAQLLRWLCGSGVKTRTLLTTRLHPKELDDLAGCRREPLKKFDPDDAVDFMRKQGVNGPRGEILHACEPYDNLPLCLRLLSGAIREDPQRPGDIAVAKDWHPDEGDLSGKQHHILEVAYDTMKKDRRDLLSRIAAMRGPVDYPTAKVLSKYTEDRELREALKELAGRGLLFWDEDRTRYDLHPIVRQYAYDRLGQEERESTHTVLKNYFATVPKPDKIAGLDDLAPAIELFHHTVSAGGYDEAFVMYRDRLTNALFFQLGAYDVDISLKLALFPDGEDNPPRLKKEADKAWTLNALAIAYDVTGRSRNAAGLIERANAIHETRGNKQGVAIGLGNLALARMLLGELKAAEESLQKSIAICREIEDEFQEAVGHKELGRLLAYMGRYQDSENEFENALGMFAKKNVEQGQCVVWSNRALRSLLLDEPPAALEALKKAREFWELDAKHDAPVERDLVQILQLSGAAHRLAGDTARAETDLKDALTHCRRIRLVEFEGNILLEMAKLRWEKKRVIGHRSLVIGEEGEAREAKRLAVEALDIADRCEYRLLQADVHNFLAQLALDEDDTRTARTEAETARERALCDGPPHCYKKALDEAQAMLDKLASGR